jgi:hypothetical protein
MLRIQVNVMISDETFVLNETITHKTFSWIHNPSHIAGFIINYIASVKALNGFRSFLLSSTGLPFHAATSRNLRCNKYCSQQCYM